MIALRNRRLVLFAADFLIYALISFIFYSIYTPITGSAFPQLASVGLLLACVFAARCCFSVYHLIWRYSDAEAFLRMILADGAGCGLYLLITRAVYPLLQEFAWLRPCLPVRIMFWQVLSMFGVSCLATVLIRILYQSFYRFYKERERGGKAPADHRPLTLRRLLFPRAAFENTANKINVAIVGAGSVGAVLAEELKLNDKAHYRPFCFIDTDPQKINKLVHGRRVYSEEGILERLKTMPIQEIVIALPKLPSSEKQRLYEFYKQSGCKVKLYDFPYAIDEERGQKRILREFSIEELLFRDAIQLDQDLVLPMYQGKTILVTGGGGSIGSELCRQLAKLNPAKLIIFDIYENNAYDIQQELRLRCGGKLNLCVEIGSVRDEKRLDEVFAAYRPEVVFHAAAHKHVPLMEHSCGEAVKNNVFGTLNTVKAAEKYGVKRFLLISTDKAVNPTNVMGASKRLCEMILQSRQNSTTRFAAVRFGNVLGSNGSVIPLFAKQLKAGGPLTLTDKRIVRYFMTIPEACQLLLQACAMARPGELYVLDMGKPVHILDLAENMIRLSGLRPYMDIDIVETGLRPGEKLYEELLIKSEKLEKTSNQMIFIEHDEPLSMDELNVKLDVLSKALQTGVQANVMEAIRATVPTYHSPEEVNRHAGEAEEMH